MPTLANAAPDQIDRPRHLISAQASTLGWALSLSIRPLATMAAYSPQSMMNIRRIFRMTGAVLSHLPKNVSITPMLTPEVRGEWVCAPEAVKSKQVALYLHGGGYFFGAAAMHRQITWRTSRALERPVLAIDYRLAPKHTFEAWRDDAVQAYEYLLNRGYAGEDIVVGGDSAGGHLTLVLLQTLRDRGLPLPSAAICISPWTDLSCESPSIRDNERRDPMIPAPTLRTLSQFLLRDRDPYDALVSPLHGDFIGLPPMFIIVGSTEVLRDDSRRLAACAQAAGVPVRYEEWHRMPHVFPIFAAILPEGRSAFEHIREFVRGVDVQRKARAA